MDSQWCAPSFRGLGREDPDNLCPVFGPEGQSNSGTHRSRPGPGAGGRPSPGRSPGALRRAYVVVCRNPLRPPKSSRKSFYSYDGWPVRIKGPTSAGATRNERVGFGRDGSVWTESPEWSPGFPRVSSDSHVTVGWTRNGLKGLYVPLTSPVTTLPCERVTPAHASKRLVGRPVLIHTPPIDALPPSTFWGPRSFRSGFLSPPRHPSPGACAAVPPAP